MSESLLGEKKFSQEEKGLDIVLHLRSDASIDHLSLLIRGNDARELIRNTVEKEKETRLLIAAR